MSDDFPSTDPEAWIERLLFEIREGEASPEEVQQLRTLLSTDRQARLHYLRLNQMDFLLSSGNHGATMAPPSQPPRLRWTRIHSLRALAGAGIAAAVAAIVWLMPPSGERTDQSASNRASKPSPASLRSTYQTVFETKKQSPQAQLQNGRLSQTAGITELELSNGARIVVEGDCELEIPDLMTLHLHHGKLWAHCPPEAHGLRVLTPGKLEIVDLGTEFGVEVSPAGDTELHVFDGLVAVKHMQQPESSRLRTGQAMTWAIGATAPRSGRADSSKFVSSPELTRLRLEKYREQMLDRQDLVLYYDFSGMDGSTAANKAARAIPGSNGITMGTLSVAGRTEDMDALLFDRRGDALALELDWPKENRSFTLALWVRADRLDNLLTALVNSSGWEPGDIHFQVTNRGALRAAINGGGEYETAGSVVRAGAWQLLAVAWEPETMTAHFSCDGRTVETRRYDNNTPLADTPPLFGRCLIGNWKDDRTRKSRVDERSFKGRIDEVMIFDRALSEQDLAELYASGRP